MRKFKPKFNTKIQFFLLFIILLQLLLTVYTFIILRDVFIVSGSFIIMNLSLFFVLYVQFLPIKFIEKHITIPIGLKIDYENIKKVTESNVLGEDVIYIHLKNRVRFSSRVGFYKYNYEKDLPEMLKQLKEKNPNIIIEVEC